MFSYLFTQTSEYGILNMELYTQPDTTLINDDVYPSEVKCGKITGHGYSCTNNVPNRDHQIIKAMDVDLVFIGSLDAGCQTKNMR